MNHHAISFSRYNNERPLFQNLIKLIGNKHLQYKYLSLSLFLRNKTMFIVLFCIISYNKNLKSPLQKKKQIKIYEHIVPSK